MAFEPGTRLGVGQRLLVGLIWLYRVTLGLFIGGRCRYLPTCSHYGEQAIRAHGAATGTWLSARRVLRCHPWGASGFDPVPRVREAIRE